MKIWLLLLCLMADPVPKSPAQSAGDVPVPPATADFDEDSDGSATSFNSIVGQNFTVSGKYSVSHLNEIKDLAEELRNSLSQHWLGMKTLASWEIRCEIVVHHTRAEYLKSVGAAGRQTAGTTSIQLQANRIVRRRIDLLEITDSVPSALRHELIHVLLADLFPVKCPPRWAEEGLALLNDPVEKQAAHRLDVRRAELQKVSFVELIKSENYPGFERRAEYYGKSLVLVEFLMQTGGPESFQKFLKRSVEADAATALQEVYGFNTVAELDGRWLDGHVAAAIATKTASR